MFLKISLPILATSLLVLAQSIPSSAITGLAEIGGLGVLVFYIWLNGMRTLPNMVKQFADQAERDRTHHAEQLDRVVDAWAQEKSACRDEIKQLTQVFVQPQKDRQRPDGCNNLE